jgi:hypothetical protein
MTDDLHLLATGDKLAVVRHLDRMSEKLYLKSVYEEEEEEEVSVGLSEVGLKF